MRIVAMFERTTVTKPWQPLFGLFYWNKGNQLSLAIEHFFTNIVENRTLP